MRALEIARLERSIERSESSTSSPREQRLADEILSYIAERPPESS